MREVWSDKAKDTEATVNAASRIILFVALSVCRLEIDVCASVNFSFLTACANEMTGEVLMSAGT
jgi:hypothetical protein